MPLLRRDRAALDPADRVTLGRALLRLDPWAFWVVELDASAGAPFAVVGVTGAFVVTGSSLEGYVESTKRELVVDGRHVGGFADAKRAARWLKGRLMSIGASSHDVSPFLVLLRAKAGAPREHRGVRVVRPEDIVPEMTRRPHTLDPGTAQRLAPRLGRVLGGREAD